MSPVAGRAERAVSTRGLARGGHDKPQLQARTREQKLVAPSGWTGQTYMGAGSCELRAAVKWSSPGTVCG